MSRWGLLVLWGACVAEPSVTDDTDVPAPDSATDTPPPDTEPAPVETGDSGPDTPPVPTAEEIVDAMQPTVWLRAEDLDLPERTPVASWLGHGSSSVDAVQEDPALRAELRRSRLNGLPALRFDGGGDRLDLTEEPFGAQRQGLFTVFVVGSVENASAHLVGTGGSEPGQLRTLGAGLFVDQGRLALKTIGPRGGFVLDQVGAPIADDAWRLYGAVVRPGATALLVDGAVVGMSEGMPAPTAFGRATVGAADGLGLDVSLHPLDGDIAEILVFSRTLEACERWEVERYLAERYGLDVAREVEPPRLWNVASDLVLPAGTGVSLWPDRRAPVVAPAFNTVPEGRPAFVPDGLLGRPTLRFDGHNDRLDFTVNYFESTPRVPTTTVVVMATEAQDGHLMGVGPSIDPGDVVIGTGLVVKEGFPAWKARSASEGFVFAHTTPVSDGVPHVLAARWADEEVRLTVDGDTESLTAPPGFSGLGRATLGAGDGSAVGRAYDALAVDVSEVRQYAYVLDDCALDRVTSELAATWLTPP